jgi:hypothetical protein
LVVRSVTASVGLGVAPQPVVAVVKVLTSSVALGVTPAPVSVKSVVVGASLALGVAPTAAVRVVLIPLPATALGVAPAPTAIVGTGFVFLPYTSRNRGRMDVTTNGNVGATYGGKVFARSQERELTSATGGRMGVTDG